MKTYDLVVFDIEGISRTGVNKVNAGGIRGIPIGYERNFLIWLGGTNGFIHGDNSGLSTSIIGDVICSNF